MKTFSLKEKDIKKNWILINAKGIVLGRLAAEVSKILRGKNKPIYSPNMNCGDNVIILNAEQIKLTGSKMKNKNYYRHTGYPGSIKHTTPEKIISGKQAQKIIELAVKRMMPRNPLGRAQMKSLKIFLGEKHIHQAQNPVILLNLAELNVKNTR